MHAARRVLGGTRARALACALGSILLGVACSEPKNTRPRSALLITLDTTRVDTLGCYGEPHRITPNLDRLAEEGVSFRWARTTAPCTAPAHASMMTGLFPPRHTVRDNSLTALPSSAVTIAERARDGGAQTAAFVASAVLDRAFGLSQGFDVYDEVARSRQGQNTHYASRPANEVVDSALAWFAERDPDRPFFVWVHFFDPHQPWNPPERFLERAGGIPYLAEIAFMDSEIGRLLDALNEEHALDETLVIAVADHGEGLGQHGEDTHGSFCYDSTLRVPLIVRYPGGERSREVSTRIASVADVYPTLVDALGLGAPGELDGESLWRREPAEDRGAYFESYYGFLHYGWSPITGWVDRRGKYVHTSQPELYDPVRKPKEGVNLLDAKSAQVESYRAHIQEIASRSALPEGEALDEELLASVRQLGYVDSGGPHGALPGLLEPTGLPSPHTRSEELRKGNEALRAAELGDRERAIVLLRELSEANPKNSFALEYLGYYLIDVHRPAEAVTVFEHLLAIGPERASTHLNLGYALQEIGEDARAIQHFSRLLEIDPFHVEGLRDLIAVLERNGRTEEAAALRKRLPAGGS